MRQKLLARLATAIAHQSKGDLICYLRRLTILPAIIKQKLKLNKLVRVPVFFGDKMYVVTDEIVSRQLITFGYAETDLVALMIQNLNQGDVFVDVGTHYGFEAMVASKILGETGEVIAFEPNPNSFEIAKKNLTNKNTRLNNLAVGDYDGIANMQTYDIYSSAMNSVTKDDEFVPSPWIRSDGGRIIKVEIVTLDTFFKDRKKPVNFIKCDVEGFETEVINGAAKLIAQDKPMIVLEADFRLNGGVSERVQGYQALMEPLNYSAFDFEFKDGILTIAEIGTLALGHPNVLFLPNK